MKPQPSVQTTSTPGLAPTTAAAHAAPAANAHVDHVPRVLRWLQSFLAGVIAALSIGANVGFHDLLARDDLVGGQGYVAALVIPVVVVRCPHPPLPFHSSHLSPTLPLVVPPPSPFFRSSALPLLFLPSHLASPPAPSPTSPTPWHSAAPQSIPLTLSPSHRPSTPS